MKTKNKKAISALIAVTVAFSILVTFSATASADATPDHYVDPAGSNTHPYDTWAKAAHSIQDAIDVAGSGDTINVAAGTYVESITMPYFAAGAGGLTVQSTDGAATTIIDCGGVSQGVQIISNDITFEGFTVKNAYTAVGHVGGKDHTLSNLIITDFMCDGLWLAPVQDCEFSDITIYGNNVGGAGGMVNGILMQKTGSGGNTNNNFENITIYNIATTGSGSSYGISMEHDLLDEYITIGNNFVNITIHDLSSEDRTRGVYIRGLVDRIDPYAIEDTTFSGGKIYGLTGTGDNKGFYVYGGCENLDITGFDITGCDEGVDFKGFDWVQPPTFPPTGWVNVDSWVASTANPRTGTYAAGISVMGMPAPTLDDYLIMPQQLISDGDTISFYAKLDYFRDSVDFKVMVSDTGTNPADFTDTLCTYPAPLASQSL